MGVVASRRGRGMEVTEDAPGRVPSQASGNWYATASDSIAGSRGQRLGAERFVALSRKSLPESTAPATAGRNADETSSKPQPDKAIRRKLWWIPESGGTQGRHLRLARGKRRRQDDDHPDAAGLMPADHGSAEILGFDCWSRAAALRRPHAYVPRTPAANYDWMAFRNSAGLRQASVNAISRAFSNGRRSFNSIPNSG